MASTDPTRSLTERFAGACVALSEAGLPLAVQQRTKLIVLDTLGAMLSASRPVFPAHNGSSSLLGQMLGWVTAISLECRYGQPPRMPH